MVASSVFIHSGLGYLFMSMFGLMWLGPIVVQRVGKAAFWPLAGLCALGAGGAYVLMTNTGLPSVGASRVCRTVLPDTIALLDQ